MLTDNNNLNFNDFEEECLALSRSSLKKISDKRPIYIFGAGRFGISLAKALILNKFNVVGFIETSPKEKFVLELPVFSWEDFKLEDISSQLLIGIFNRDIPVDRLKAIANSAGFKDILMPWEFYSQLGEYLGWRYWLSGKDVILESIKKIKIVFDLLSDQESKNTLINICKFRLGLDDSYAGFKHEDCQYFNGLTLHRFSGVNSCIYVDCGAYNGDTFLQANESLPLTRAYLFEPDPINFKHLVQVVKHASIDSVCLPLAISDHYEVLSFAGDGEGGTITLDGSLHIAAVSLDELMPHAMVDFIKFDIEGSEVPAILGAIELIKRSRPTLVLSLYHRPADLWEIPILLANCCHGYKFYIRQHFNNSFDSVLYAIPS